MGVSPLEVTILRRGSFKHYYSLKKASGSDLALRRPPRMNASDEVIENLVGRRVTERQMATIA